MQTENEGMREDTPRKREPEERAMATLTSDKTDFKTKTVTRDEEGAA